VYFKAQPIGFNYEYSGHKTIHDQKKMNMPIILEGTKDLNYVGKKRVQTYTNPRGGKLYF